MHTGLPHKSNNIKKKGRVRHLPDSCLQILLERREHDEKIQHIDPTPTDDESHSVG